MAVTVKTKIKRTGADAEKVVAAFHEVHSVTPKAVKHTARKFGKARAEKQRVAIALNKARAAGADVPDASGANYVSRNVLHVQPVANEGVRVPHQDAESYSSENEVQTVACEKNPCEQERSRNNAARDARTNLGRGKAPADLGDVD